ncbi:hypothetical protein [Nitratidesulfovibrio liaohensis]|uniref:hypothetical protein n=1 Tax=Nitratidesulfovibrio liaohensis TaxID=2604158 RepID=UPI00141DA7C5|nr:hypothetical protein [Nitratidesulfovibrio liaohensis]NHZ46539.1 hypothetical protein [Nitratidesulfovibrio liaohensis]
MSDANICGKDTKILQQFRTTLSAQAGLLARGPFRGTEVHAAVAARLEKPDFSWDDAYFVEQSLAPFHTDERVLIEIERLLAQARSIMDPGTAGFYAEVDPKPMSSQCRRELFARILVDLQLESQKRERRKWLLERTCKYLVWLMLGTFAVMLFHAELSALAAAVFWMVAGWLVNWMPGGMGSAGVPWRGPGIGQVMLLALAGGCAGALVTVALRMNNYFKTSRLREVESYASAWYIGNRMLIGAVGALAGCYLVNAKIISLFNINDLFLPLGKGGGMQGGATVYSIDVLKTVVVSIAFGCSEYFIPATFGKLPVPKADAGGTTGTAAGASVSPRAAPSASRPHPAQAVRSGKAAGADRDASPPKQPSEHAPEHAPEQPTASPPDPLDLLDRLNLDERLEAEGTERADTPGNTPRVLRPVPDSDKGAAGSGGGTAGGAV